MKSDKTFLLITGCMRSGTTLMGELMHSRVDMQARHPEIALDNDSLSIIKDLSAFVRRTECPNSPILKCDPSELLAFSETSAEKFYNTLSSRISYVEESKKGAFCILADHIEREILAATNSRGLKSVIGIKTTHLMMEFYLLRKLYKNVKMLVMVRDPRDIISSIVARGTPKIGRGSYHYILSLMMNYFIFLRNNEDNKSIIHVKYEELIADPNYVLRKVLNTLDLDVYQYDWNSLESGFVSSNSSFNSSKGKGFVKNVGINSNNIGKNRHVLTEWELDSVETLTKKYMQYFGYSAARQSNKKLFGGHRMIPNIVSAFSSRNRRFNDFREKNDWIRDVFISQSKASTSIHEISPEGLNISLENIDSGKLVDFNDDWRRNLSSEELWKFLLKCDSNSSNLIIDIDNVVQEKIGNLSEKLWRAVQDARWSYFENYLGVVFDSKLSTSDIINNCLRFLFESGEFHSAKFYSNYAMETHIQYSETVLKFRAEYLSSELSDREINEDESELVNLFKKHLNKDRFSTIQQCRYLNNIVRYFNKENYYFDLDFIFCRDELLLTLKNHEDIDEIKMRKIENILNRL